MNVIHAFSRVLGEAVNLVSRMGSFFLFTFSPVCCYQVPFQPAKVIFVGMDVLLAVRMPCQSPTSRSHYIWMLQAASGVSSSYDALVDLFDCVGNFLKCLRIHTNLPLTPSMMEISVKVMVDLLSVLALATKQIKLGRFSKWVFVLDMW